MGLARSSGLAPYTRSEPAQGLSALPTVSDAVPGHEVPPGGRDRALGPFCVVPSIDHLVGDRFAQVEAVVSPGELVPYPRRPWLLLTWEEQQPDVIAATHVFAAESPDTVILIPDRLVRTQAVAKPGLIRSDVTPAGFGSPLWREFRVDVRPGSSRHQEHRAVVRLVVLAALEQNDVVRPVEQRIERAADRAVEVHRNEPIAEEIGSVGLEHHQPAKAARPTFFPGRYPHALELARWLDDLDGRIDSFRSVGDACQAMRKSQVTTDHGGPDIDMVSRIACPATGLGP